jgi:hypothetical protein
VLIGGVLAAATSLHFPVSTTNAQAQAAMDRGLFLYYAYDRDAAHRYFAAAASFDPHLAIAYWGLALADGPDLNTPMTEKRFDEGRSDIGAAVARASSASDRNDGTSRQRRNASRGTSAIGNPMTLPMRAGW